MSGSCSGSPNTPPTIRSLWLGVQTRHFEDPDWKILTGGSVCVRCKRLWPCDDRKDAVAALDLLNNCPHMRAGLAPNDWSIRTHRLVPDPEGETNG